MSTSTTLNLDQMIADALAAQKAADDAKAAAERTRQMEERRAANTRAYTWFVSIFGDDLARALGVNAGEGYGFNQASFVYGGVTFTLTENGAARVYMRAHSPTGGNDPVVPNTPLGATTQMLLAFVGRVTQGG